NYDRSVATNGFNTLTTLNPVGGNYGTASGPSSQIHQATNYSGTSTLFGNIVSLAAGPNNTLYAAVARSFVDTDPPDVQKTEGPFANPDAVGPTPSMVISFADCSGAGGGCDPVSFSPPINFSAGTNPHGIAVGDFNEDGTLDLAVVNSGAGTVSVLLGIP